MSSGLLLAACLAACSESSPPQDWSRDWSRQPAFLVEATPAAKVWVTSDVHGGIERLVTLLQGQALIDANQSWTGGTGHLYVLGDLIDKSTGGLRTIRLLQRLQREAKAAGGEVVVTMGNHEAEFLADPFNDKAAPFLVDLSEAHLDPEAVVEGSDDLGVWIQSLPFGIVDGDWFFSHAGNTDGRSLEQLATEIETGVRANGFDAKALAGSKSLLEAELWWETTDPVATVDTNLAALGVKHLVFGHDPSALAKRGTLGHLLDGRLFLVDVGMSPAVNDSQGALLLIERGAGGTVVSAAFPSGPPAALYED